MLDWCVVSFFLSLFILELELAFQPYKFHAIYLYNIQVTVHKTWRVHNYINPNVHEIGLGHPINKSVLV